MNLLEKNKITVWKDGKEQEADIISIFELPEFGKEYVIYTFNEQQKDSVKILASTLKREEDAYVFESINTEEEWQAIKNIIKQLAEKGREANNGE